MTRTFASILRNYFWYTKLYGSGLLEDAKLADLNTALERKPASAEREATTTTPIDSTIRAILRADAGLASRPPASTGVRITKIRFVESFRYSFT